MSILSGTLHYFCSDELTSHHVLHLIFLFNFILTYEEYQVHHQQHLLMRQKLSHRLLYVLDQHQDNNEMDVFHLQLLHFQIHHLLYQLYLYIHYQVYVFVMFVELKVNRYNKQQHNLLNQV
jgi:hypothetical protein